MKKSQLRLMVAITTTSLGVAVFSCSPSSEEATHESSEHGTSSWSYEGETGPDHWGSLSEEFKLASVGQEQSPIDLPLPSSAPEDLPDLILDYQPSTIDLVFNGHTIQENHLEASSLTVEDASFSLKQFHFHSPSEHTVDGKSFPLEMHLVHADESGKLAVVGVLIEEGASNDSFSPLWADLPGPGRELVESGNTFSVEALLPEDRSYFHYQGSLTTPPCSEGVKWYVLATPIEMSREQIEQFDAIIKGNNRPVQPLHARTVAFGK